VAEAGAEVLQEVKDVEQSLDVGTTLAFERTWVAYERTMLAWIRTSASLITFGFSVYKFFDLAEPLSGKRHPIGARTFGMLLVCIGLVSLLLATIEYRKSIRDLSKRFRHKRTSTAVIVAGLVGVLGILALLLINFRQ
jgi:putative membrane protein